MSDETKVVGEKPCIRLCRKDENGELIPVGALWLKAAKPYGKVKAYYVGYVGNFGRQDIVAFDN